MEDAAKQLQAVGEARSQQSEAGRLIYEKFHTNLALISGGAITLSFTLLSYAKGIKLVHVRWLHASWMCLIAAMIASLFYILFNAHYGFYFREREYYEALK